MKKFICCTLLVIAVAALLTTGALAYDMLDPPMPGAADGWYEIESTISLRDPSNNSWVELSKLTTSYEYNADKLPVRSKEVYSDGESAEGADYVMEYDSQGRVSRSARADGNHESVYAYRDDGSFLETYTWWYDDEPEAVRTNYYTYDPKMDWFWYGAWDFEMNDEGWITRRWNDADEYVYTFEDDGEGRIGTVRVENTRDHTVYHDYYTYSVDGYSFQEVTRTGFEEFIYNNDGQLVSYVYGYDEQPYVFYYEYDAAGNCISVESDARKWSFRYETPNAGFDDVTDPDAFYYAAVYWAVEQGITTGATPTTFAPSAPCTRAQVVTFLWRAAGSPAPTSGKNPFSDVAKGAYYYDAVLWAVEKGITTGTTATTFSPNSTCTRGQVVTFLWRDAGAPHPMIFNIPFADVRESDYFSDAVLWALEKNITKGTTETTFSPQSQCQRAHVVTFLFRAK